MGSADFAQVIHSLSFIVIKERRINEALTGDAHFEQAGYRALLA